MECSENEWKYPGCVVLYFSPSLISNLKQSLHSTPIFLGYISMLVWGNGFGAFNTADLEQTCLLIPPECICLFVICVFFPFSYAVSKKIEPFYKGGRVQVLPRPVSFIASYTYEMVLCYAEAQWGRMSLSFVSF